MRSWANAVGIRSGEGRLVGLLAANAFFLALPLPVLETVSAAVFLEHHPARDLPIVYLGGALVVPATAWLLLRLGRRASFTFVLCAMVVVGAVGTAMLAAWLGAASGGPASVIFPVWTQVVVVFSSLGTWPLLTRLLDPDQTKRLSGLVAGANTAAWIVGGLAVWVFVGLLGPALLLGVAGAAALGALAIVGAVRARWPLAGDAEPTARERARPRGSYGVALVACFGIGWFVYYFGDLLFLREAEIRFGDVDELAAFLGLLFGIVDVVILVCQVAVTGPVMRRRGLRWVLLLLPVLTTAGALAVLGAGAAGVTGLAFVLVVLVKVNDRIVRSSVSAATVIVLVQPLAAAVGTAMQTKITGIIAPVASGLAAVTLIGLGRLGAGTLELAAALSVIGVAWAVSSRALATEYRGVLQRAIASRGLRPRNLEIGELEVRRVVERSLRSAHAGEVRYALRLLEEVDPVAARGEALALTGHADPGVRADALRVAQDDRALRAALDDPEPAPRLTALEAFARRGEELATVAEMARAADPARRREAAQVLREVSDPPAVPIITPLLDDHDPSVRRAAIRAAALHPALQPRVAAALADRRVRSAVLESLTVWPQAELPDVLWREGAAALAGRLGDASRLWAYAVDDDVRVVAAALEGLAALPQIDRDGDAVLERQLVVARSLLSTARGIDEPLLAAAVVADADRARDRVLLALTLVVAPPARPAVLRARQGYRRERALALELLDDLLPARRRAAVLGVLGEHPPDAEGLAVASLIDVDDGTVCDWTKRCARAVLQRSDGMDLSTIEKVLILRGVGLFAELPEELLAAIADVAREESHSAGAVVVRQGDVGDCLYLIAEGEVDIICDGEHRAVEGERSIFGQMALLDAEPRSATVITRTASILLRVDRDDFLELMNDRVEIAHGIIRELLRMLRER